MTGMSNNIGPLGAPLHTEFAHNLRATVFVIVPEALFAVLLAESIWKFG